MIEPVDLGAENDERMARLREALALGVGFQLVILQVEPGEQREEVLRRLAGWAGRNGVPQLERVRLAAGESTVMRLAGEHAGVILVGLEAEGPDRAERTRQMVTELNWSRDRLPELVRGPLILVVSQRVQIELFEQAPDFYSWRTHSTSIAPQPRRPGAALPIYWLDIAEPEPEDPEALQLMIARTEALRPPPLRELGLLYARLASALSRRGEHAGVDAALDAAYRAYASGGTPDDRVNALLLRGEVAQRRGSLDEAGTWLGKARCEAQTVSASPRVAAKLKLFEVMLEIERGHEEIAAAALPSAMEAARAVDEPRMEAAMVLAGAHLADPDDVAALLHRALDLYRQAQEPAWESSVLEMLASDAATRGRSDEAEAYARDAVARAEASGAVDAILEARARLAEIALDHGDLDLAEHVLGVIEPNAGARAAGRVAAARAALARRRSDDVAVERHLRDALEAYRRSGDVAQVVEVSLDLAQLAASNGHWALALTGFETADRLGDPRQRAVATFGLAGIALDREEWTAALADQLAAVIPTLVAAGEATRADLLRMYQGFVLERLGRGAEAHAEWRTALVGFEARGQADLAAPLRKLLAKPAPHGG